MHTHVLSNPCYIEGTQWLFVYFHSTMDENQFINLNLNVRGLGQSATLAINEKSNELARKGKQIYKFGLGQSPFPVPDSVQEALREHAHQKDYLPVKGLEELRSSVAAFSTRETGVKYTWEDTLIGPGSKELIFILQLVYYGDLIIPAPGWVSYSPQARIVGRNVHWIPTRSKDRWRLRPEQLDMLCRTDPYRPRLVILNYPSNPTGCSYTGDELKELADVARKYKVIIVSDEIYGLLNHKGEHVSIAQYYPEGTIVSGGLSKWCGAGGWRLGTFTFPEKLRWLLDAMAIVASETFTSTAAPIQYAGIRAFDFAEDIQTYVSDSQRVLKILGKHLTRSLRNSGLKLNDPEGGFYLFPDLLEYREELNRKGLFTSVEVCQRLLEDTGIATLPGHDFGRDPEELTLRMSYVDFDGDKALRGIHGKEVLKEDEPAFVKEHFSRIMEATQVMDSWLRSL